VNVADSFRPVGEAAGAFWRWWGSELAGLVPGFLARLMSRERQGLVLSAGNGGFQLLHERAGRRANEAPKLLAGPGPLPDLAGVLAKQVSRAPKTLVIIRLRWADCLTRQVSFPRQARDKLRSILELDIERVTPFRRDELYFDHAVAATRGADGRLDVLQVMAERGLVDSLLDQVRAQGVEVGQVDCWSADGKTPLAIDLLGPAAGSRPVNSAPRSSITWALAALALAFAGGATLLDFDRYETALAALETDIQASQKEEIRLRRNREGLLSAQSAANQLLQRKQQQSAVVAILEDVTRRLPDDSWLTSLRIEGRTIDMAGYSKSAASLVTTFQKAGSPGGPGTVPVELSAPQLTSPVTFDLTKEREQFSLRLNVGKAPAPEPAAIVKPGPGPE